MDEVDNASVHAETHNEFGASENAVVVVIHFLEDFLHDCVLRGKEQVLGLVSGEAE